MITWLKYNLRSSRQNIHIHTESKYIDLDHPRLVLDSET